MDEFGEGKTWRRLEQGRETKLIESYGEDFRAVATPNREKPTEEESRWPVTLKQARYSA